MKNILALFAVLFVASCGEMKLIGEGGDTSGFDQLFPSGGVPAPTGTAAEDGDFSPFQATNPEGSSDEISGDATVATDVVIIGETADDTTTDTTTDTDTSGFDCSQCEPGDVCLVDEGYCVYTPGGATTNDTDTDTTDGDTTASGNAETTDTTTTTEGESSTSDGGNGTTDGDSSETDTATDTDDDTTGTTFVPECVVGQIAYRGTAIGLCTRDERACTSDGTWAAEWKLGVQAVPEVPDGLDNNCNGKPDEDFPCPVGVKVGGGFSVCEFVESECRVTSDGLSSEWVDTVPWVPCPNGTVCNEDPEDPRCVPAPAGPEGLCRVTYTHPSFADLAAYPCGGKGATAQGTSVSFETVGVPACFNALIGDNEWACNKWEVGHREVGSWSISCVEGGKWVERVVGGVESYYSRPPASDADCRFKLPTP